MEGNLQLSSTPAGTPASASDNVDCNKWTAADVISDESCVAVVVVVGSCVVPPSEIVRLSTSSVCTALILGVCVCKVVSRETQEEEEGCDLLLWRRMETGSSTSTSEDT